MINILYISTSSSGGAADSLFNMISSVKSWVKPTVLVDHAGYVSEKCKSKGIDFIIVPFEAEMTRFSISSVSDLKYNIKHILKLLYNNTLFLHRIVRKLRGRHFDIVHTNNGAMTIGIHLAKKLGCKHIWHLREFQDLDFDSRPFWGWNRFYKLLNQSDAIISITQAVSNRFQPYVSFRIKVLWNAIARKDDIKYEKTKEDYIFFAASSISEQKGLHDLIEAYAHSNLLEKNIRLKIAGHFYSIDYKKKIDELISQYNLLEQVDFLGFCKDISGYMLRAKGFVMPSKCEALGRVAIQAMFNGCPVICRNSGGPSEFIFHEVNGYLFDSNENLKKYLIRVCNTDCDVLIKDAQSYAIRNFSEEEYGKRLIDIYRNSM